MPLCPGWAPWEPGNSREKRPAGAGSSRLPEAKIASRSPRSPPPLLPSALTSSMRARGLSALFLTPSVPPATALPMKGQVAFRSASRWRSSAPSSTRVSGSGFMAVLREGFPGSGLARRKEVQVHRVAAAGQGGRVDAVDGQARPPGAPTEQAGGEALQGEDLDAAVEQMM